jgi:hypothetical protein
VTAPAGSVAGSDQACPCARCGRFRPSRMRLTNSASWNRLPRTGRFDGSRTKSPRAARTLNRCSHARYSDCAIQLLSSIVAVPSLKMMRPRYAQTGPLAVTLLTAGP